jgi:hypothetical protein
MKETWMGFWDTFAVFRAFLPFSSSLLRGASRLVFSSTPKFRFRRMMLQVAQVGKINWKLSRG